MSEVISALLNALRSLLHPRMLALLIWPIALAVVVWVIIAWMFWGNWAQSLQDLLVYTGAQVWFERWELKWVAGSLITVAILLLLVPAMVITAMLIIALIAMPMMVRHVASRDYADLEMRHGGSVLGSIWNALVAVTAFIVLWLLALPLWFFIPFNFLISWALTTYLNQRLFRYDSLAEHASREEYQAILEHSGGRLYLLAAILALLYHVPLLGLVLPTYSALAFVHLCLSELRRLRAQQTNTVIPATP